MSADENISVIAKLILNTAFNKNNSINKVYLENAVNMVHSIINKLRKIKISGKVEIVNNPENGGWIKAFYDFSKNNLENKEDVTFVYKFASHEKEILAKKEDIDNWTKKWLEYSKTNSLAKLRLLMGEDNWNGKMLDRDKYVTNQARIKLFGRNCKNKGNKNVEGCYGIVLMHKTLFTETENDSGLCKKCEAEELKRLRESKKPVKTERKTDISLENYNKKSMYAVLDQIDEEGYLKEQECVPNEKQLQDREYDIAERVALKVLESDTD